MTSVRFDLGGGLAVHFEDLPAPLAHRVADYLAYFAATEPGRGPELAISADPPPETGGRRRLVVEDQQLRVFEDSSLLLFELPGATGWVRPAAGTGGLWLETPADDVLDRFVGLALAPMLIELAQPQGLLGVHAAAVAVEGRGILLPGPSGCGKSTLFRNCHSAGLDVLSDDLVWVSRGEGSSPGYRLHAFPRGLYAERAPAPSVRAAALSAIVCPTLVAEDRSRLVKLAPGQVLDVLLAESGFLARGPRAAERFESLARLAGARPGFRLEAGRDRDQVAGLLATTLQALAEEA